MDRPPQQQVFEHIGAISARGGKAGRPVVDRLFGRALPASRDTSLDWADDADWARLQQEPLRARAMLRIALLAFISLIVWAAFAEVDEVTRGEGRIIPSRQLQIVQSVDGGVVEELMVREGDIVEAGQMLARIDPTRFESSLRENRVQYLALQAQGARLTALTQGGPLEFPEEVEQEAPDLAAHERRLYETSLSELEGQTAIARQQVTQRRQELREAESRRATAGSTLSLINQELKVTQPMLASGAVSEVEILRLRREQSIASGQYSQAAAQISRIQSAIAEAEGREQEVALKMRNEWRVQLSSTMSKLASLQEGSSALADRVKHSSIRSPVRGTVSRRLVSTVGGVVQPGTGLFEIVPLGDALLVEARIAPKDIAFLRPGQDAIVKFTAYDFAIYGGMEATLEHISADTVTDDQGHSFYVVRVRTREVTFGENQPIIPGMTTQVDILTGKKTILTYLLKPVLRAKANALSER